MLIISLYIIIKYNNNSNNNIVLNYLDLSNNNKDNKSTLINIEKGHIKFNNNPTTYSDDYLSNDFNNIILFGSKIIKK